MPFGLLGKKLGHSYSPQIHSYLADYSYVLFEKKPEELNEFFLNGDFQGLNVTIPYKKDVIPYCAELSSRAKQLGAVNTIVRRADGSLIGHNTDYFGFSSMVKRSNLQVSGKKVLILGSGGSSVTAAAVMEELGARVVIISRSGDNNYTNLHRHSDASVIVNTTPVGMYPNVGVSPLDLSLFPKLEGVLDIIYNPSRTQLLLDAEARGLVSENGLWMLVAQAKESAEWFTGKKIPDSEIASIHNILRRQMENIVLIGMPGSGKSTIGRLLAQKSGRHFIDADTEIERKANMHIPEIFSKYQENGFRKYESEVLADLGKLSGIVIATGGGCVTREENYNFLHQNGTIVWLQRSIDQLASEGRPLSQNADLKNMYAIREPMYHKFADIVLQNNSEPNNIADTLLHILDKEKQE